MKATASATEAYARKLLSLIDFQGINFPTTCSRSFTRTGQSKHNKANNQILKAGKVQNMAFSKIKKYIKNNLICKIKCKNCSVLIELIE